MSRSREYKPITRRKSDDAHSQFRDVNTNIVHIRIEVLNHFFFLQE